MAFKTPLLEKCHNCWPDLTRHARPGKSQGRQWIWWCNAYPALKPTASFYAENWCLEHVLLKSRPIFRCYLLYLCWFQGKVKLTNLSYNLTPPLKINMEPWIPYPRKGKIRNIDVYKHHHLLLAFYGRFFGGKTSGRWGQFITPHDVFWPVWTRRYLEDHPMTCKWLITMVIVSPLRIGLFPFQMALFWLINRGDPNHLLNGSPSSEYIQITGWRSLVYGMSTKTPINLTTLGDAKNF